MAIQVGMFPLIGSMGNVTFYQHANGKFLARQKGGVSRKRFFTAKEFEGSRRAGREFGRASRASGIIRRALWSSLRDVDKLGHSKLTALLQRVIQTDKLRRKGERLFAAGDRQLYQGLELGKDSVAGMLGGLPDMESFGEGRYLAFGFGKLSGIPIFPKGLEADCYGLRVHGIVMAGEGKMPKHSKAKGLPLMPLDKGPEDFGSQVLDFGDAVTSDSVILGALSLRFFSKVNGAPYLLAEHGGVCLMGRG